MSWRPDTKRRTKRAPHWKPAPYHKQVTHSKPVNKAASRIAKARGWAWYGGYYINSLTAENPPRQGVAWNTRESLDLLNEWAAGWTIERIAWHHGRSEGGVAAQLMYCRERADTQQAYKHAVANRPVAEW